ncbi:MAG: hypothetical protein ABJB61_02970, partial [bacterium]
MADTFTTGRSFWWAYPWNKIQWLPPNKQDGKQGWLGTRRRARSEMQAQLKILSGQDCFNFLRSILPRSFFGSEETNSIQ